MVTEEETVLPPHQNPGPPHSPILCWSISVPGWLSESHCPFGNSSSLSTQNDIWLSLWLKAHDERLISTRAVFEQAQAVQTPMLEISHSVLCQTGQPPVSRQNLIPENSKNMSAGR